MGVGWRTGCEHVLHSGVRGKHLTHELLLLLPEVVLQVIRQHHISSLLHRHHLAKHLQLGDRETREDRWAERKAATETKTRKMRPLHLPCFCTVTKINPTLMLLSVCLFKRLVLVPGGGRETALLYFWLATMCPCHALPPPFQSCKHRQTHTHTNMHIEYTRNHFHDLIHSPLFRYIIDNYYTDDFIRGP